MTGNFLLLLLVFPATLMLPGFLVARRLRAEPLEQLLAAAQFTVYSRGETDP